MVVKIFPAGVISVSVPVDSDTALPSCATLAFTASAIAPDSRPVFNDVKRPLDTTQNHQVIVGLVGRDATKGGLTIGACSPSSGNIALDSTNNCIKVKVTSAQWAALGGSVSEAFAVACWVKVGNADFKLTDFAYFDPSTDFVHTIMARPLNQALTKTSAILNSTTVDDDLGDRSAKGFTFRTLSPTTGGVNLVRDVDAVEFSPDTARNFSQATTRTIGVNFELLAADLKDVVQGNAGQYVTYTDGGTVYEESQMSLFTAAIFATGTKPLKLTMLPDAQGYTPIKLLLGCSPQNQEGNQESYTKDGQLSIRYSFSSIPNDTLTDNMETEITWKKKA